MATINWNEYIEHLNAKSQPKCLACKNRIGATPFMMNMRLYCSCDCATANERAIEERESEFKSSVMTFVMSFEQKAQ